MEKLPIEFKEKWVAALRSGEYKQGTQFLFNASNNAFCCLGVGCIVAGVEKERVQGIEYISAGIAITTNIPDGIVGFAGANHNVKTLSQMNDEEGKSFSEIADYIEENL